MKTDHNKILVQEVECVGVDKDNWKIFISKGDPKIIESGRNPEKRPDQNQKEFE